MMSYIAVSVEYQLVGKELAYGLENVKTDDAFECEKLQENLMRSQSRLHALVEP